MSVSIDQPVDLKDGTKTGLQVLQERYPLLWAQFKNEPEVLMTLVAASDGWSTARFQEALQNTNWWKSRTEEQRQWDTLSVIDPAEAQKRFQTQGKAITDTMARLGLSQPVTGNKNADFAQAMQVLYHVTSQNLSPSQLADYLTIQYSGDPKLKRNQNAAGGEILANMEKIRNMQSDYGLPKDPAGNLWHAQNIARGVNTMESIQGDLAKQAKGLFAPEVGAAIDRGQTVRQWASPYLATASQNLEIGQDSIDLSDPKWQGFLKTTDPTSGHARAMTQAEWQAKIRTDTTYGFDRTSTARQSAAQLATSLAQSFGAI